MADGHGGARPGAGRKRNSEKYAKQITAFHDQAAADLDDRYAALQLLADGGWGKEEVDEVWQPAGLIQISRMVETDSGSARVTELAFPHLDPEKLVCVRRTVKKATAAPDRQANQYLVDRVGGKPVQAIEGELDIADPNAIVDRFEAAIAKVYGEDDESSEQDGGE